MPELSDNEKYDLGFQIGTTIVGLFKIMAIVDGVSLQEAIDGWMESYIADRIIEATGETDAPE